MLYSSDSIDVDTGQYTMDIDVFTPASIDARSVELLIYYTVNQVRLCSCYKNLWRVWGIIVIN